MSEDKIADFFASISSHIASIDAKLDVFVEKLADHERRLCVIEHPSTGKDHGGLVMLLARALLFAVAGLAAGAGAGGILSQLVK